jgi:exonuclease SbcC
MIPLELHIEGFFSYRSRQSVDFRPLIEAGLFAILGPTGSGKSALIEAMLLALYGSCPRMERSISSLINRECPSLTIDFTFQLDAEHTERYRCLYQARLLPNGKVQRQQHRLYRWQHNSWQPLGKSPAEAIPELIGLDYDNFCRTILLPQGQFHEFLSLTPKERADALQSLFRLHRYNLWDTLRDLSHKAAAELEALEQRLTELRHRGSEDDLERLRQEYHQLLAHQEELAQQEATLQAEDQRLTQLAHRWQDYQRWNAELQERRKQLPAYTERQHLLQRLQRLQPLWERLRQLSLQHASTTERLRHLQQEAQRAAAELARFQYNYERLRPEYENRHRLEHECQLLRDALQYAEYRRQLEQLRQRVHQHQETLETLHQQRSALLQRIEQLRREEHQLQEELRQLEEVLPELTRWYERYRALLQQQAKLGEKLRHLHSRQEALGATFWQRCAELPPAYRPAPQPAHQLLEALQAAEARLREDLQRLEHELNRQQIRFTAAQLARNLLPGHPCPVCGSPHHPSPSLPDPEAERHLEELRSQLQHLRTTGELLRQLSAQLQTHLSEVDHQRQLVQSELAALEQELAHHRAAFHWEGWSPDDTPEQLHAAQRRRAELRNQLQRCRTTSDQLHQELMHIEAREHQTRQTFEQETAQYNALSGQCHLLHQRLPDHLRELPPEELQQRLQSLEHRLQTLESTFPQLEQQYRQKQQQSDALQTQLQTLAAQAHELETQRLEAQQDFHTRCHAEQLPPEEAERLLQSGIDIAEEWRRIHEFFARLQELQNRCAEIQQEAHQYDPAEHERIRSQRQQLRDQLSQLHQQLGRLSEQIHTLEEALQQQQYLRQRHAEQTAYSHRLKILEELFRGNAFVNFVAHHYLRSLCMHANRYFFAWTQGTLELTLGEDSRPLVRDLLHGGAERPIHTLSGGQLFQASLAMALALSDMVRASARLHRCLFFIDEGFGNLDRQNLLLVMDTLRQLRRQGRLVGIISHREELQHEVDAYIRISREPHRGSVIQPGWLPYGEA